VNDRRARASLAQPGLARPGLARPFLRRSPQLAGLVGALALSLVVAACAGSGKTGGVASLSGSDKPTATSTGGSSKDPKQALLAFSRCMREHGIDMPDPKFDSSGRATLTAKVGPGSPRPDDAKFKAAQRACQKNLPNGGQPPKPDPEQTQRALQYARCMRQHGVNIPDPRPGGGITIDGNTLNLKPDDPKFKAADQACQHFLGGKGGTFTESGNDSR
jgi:hypothetical protein